MLLLFLCSKLILLFHLYSRTCGEDKRWSGQEPKCKEINCGSPGFLPNGWLEGSRMNLGDVVNFKCVEGMKFEGESLSTTCQVREGISDF